ncbi:MAG: sirohydrochlorin cobaltochelatase [Desulfobacterales bacterium]|nr:MAG: sirohydrochlorin cobaltochelatase [Desulfobacterales bacterium]
MAVVIWAGISLNTFAAGQSESKKKGVKVAIMLASFGTTVPSALESITNIQRQIQTAFPDVPVRVTFTSNIIRSVWKKRQAEAQKWLDQGIPADILYVKNIIASFGDLFEDGYRNIIVQPTHMFFMEQSHDLAQYVNAMRSIRTIKEKWMPFEKIALGRPALGTVGARYDYHQDIDKALRTLAPDIELARKQTAKLVYMAHGNAHWPTGIYSEAAKMMREMYPDVVTFIGAVEGYPGIDDVVRYLSNFDSGNIILKPFMIVAGDHAVNDMAGNEQDSWKSVLTAKGFKVLPVLEGLGSNDDFAQIFVAHIKDAARDAGIPLK